MKIYIQVDFEGATGFIEWDQSFSQSLPMVEKRNRLRKIITAEVNAAIEGLFAGGGKEIVVWDSHGPSNNCNNLYFEDLNPEVWVIIGWKGLPEFYPTLDESFDAGVYIGGHAMEGTPQAITPHTCGEINGIKLGEVGMFAAICGWYKIPVIFVSGDKATIEEVKSNIPDIHYVITKEAFGPYSAKTRVPKKSQELIRSETEKALKNISRIKPFIIESPYNVGYGSSKKCKDTSLRVAHHEALSKWADFGCQDVQPERDRVHRKRKKWGEQCSFLVPK